MYIFPAATGRSPGTRGTTREVPIEPLTARQRAYLKKLAHHLKPVHHIGKAGVSGPTIEALRDAQASRELMKVKVLDVAPADARATGDALVQALGDTHLVQVIGRTLVLYRPDPEEPEIQLPG